MTIEEYLNRCRDLRRRSDRLKRKYDEAKEAAIYHGLSVKIGGPAPSRNFRDYDKGLVKMVDAEQRYKEALLDYVECRQDVFACLIDMEDILEADVLIKRYVHEMPIDLLCESISPYNYGKPLSRTHFFRVLKKGKQHLREMLQRSGLEIE